MREKLKKEQIGFAQVKNEVLCNSELSLKAKGLFAYIYSKPDDWDFSMHRIHTEMKDGKESVRTALLELEENGYLTRNRLSNGRMEYFITYKPCSDYANKVKSQQGKIGTVSNKELLQTKINNKQEARIENPRLSEPEYEETDRSQDTYKTRRKIAEQKGIILKPSKTSTKQMRSITVFKLLDYFKRKAYDFQGLEYFNHPADKNKKVQGQASTFFTRCDDNKQKAEEVINWYLDEYGAWCDYEPEQCFTYRTVQKFENKDKVTSNKRQEGVIDL